MERLIRDDQLSRTLERVAAVCARVLDDPESMLGWAGSGTSAAGEHRSFGPRARYEVLHRVLGHAHPGSPEWAGLPPGQRAAWWSVYVGRMLAVPVAAPNFFGALSDRLPLQAALGASAQCLVVCAVANEWGLTDPDDWVPLMAQVVFGRTLERAAVAVPKVSLVKLPADGPVGGEGSTDEDERSLLRRGAGVLWAVARVLLGVNSLFDERPRGKWRYRVLGNLPVVGVLGGWLDERGGLAEAARRTTALVAWPSRSAGGSIDGV